MSALTSDPEVTKTFSEVKNHQEPKIRYLWRGAIKKDFKLHVVQESMERGTKE